MEETKKKSGIFSKIFKSIKYLFVFLLPSLKLLSLNKYLNRGYKIEKDKWFLKQKQRNIILSIVLIIPLFLTFYKTYKIIDNDVNFKLRINKLNDKGFMDKINSIGELVSINKNDPLALKETKFETQARFLASGIVLFTGISLQFFLILLIMKYHPLIVETNKLKKQLSGTIIKSENIDKALVFATPIGFLIDITGHSPDEVVRHRSIWDALNLTVKDFTKDPDQKSIVFFRKGFELQDKYMYEKI